MSEETQPPSGDPADVVKLTLLVHLALMDRVREYAARKGISVTEATRRAYTVLLSVDEYYSRGATLDLDENGVLHEVLFLV